MARLQVRRASSATPPATSTTGPSARSSASWRRASRSSRLRTPLPWTMALCRVKGQAHVKAIRSGWSGDRGRAPGAGRDRLPGHRLGRWRCTRWAGRSSRHYAQVRALADGTGRDRPLALGDQRQGLDRRPLLLGQVTGDGGADDRRCTWRSRASAASTPRARRRRTRATPSSRAGSPTESPAIENTAMTPQRGRSHGGAHRGGDAGRLGADAAGGRDPRGAAAVRRPLGRPTGSSPATGRPRRSRSGSATILMIFAAEYFSHVISAALGFAAFRS